MTMLEALPLAILFMKGKNVMKKLLLIALLTVAMVFTLVACTEEKPPEETTGETKGDTIPVTGDETEPETPAEDTNPSESETDPPVEDTKAPETDPPVEDTKAPETDPPVEDTKAPETDPPVVDEGPVMWDVNKDVVTHLSFDELRKNDTTDGIFAPGQAAGWDLQATVEEEITSLKFWGWIGIADAEVGLFGYQIDDNAPIYDAAWTHATGDDVIAAAAGTGAQTASRMLINIDLSKIAGEHTVKTLYKNAAGDKEVILAEFTITRNAPQILDSASAGMVAMNKDAESSDNYSASLAGWIGFGQPVTQLGYSVDGGAYVWLDGGINANPEDGVKAAAGEFAIRYDIKVDLTGVEFGEHEVVYVVRLEDRNICEFYGTVVITNDPSYVGDSTYNFDSNETPDLGGLFTFKAGLAPEGCVYTAAPYKMTGINQLTLTAEGTFAWTVKNLVTADGHAALFVRGNPSPSFGDANYYGHDGNNDKANLDSLSVGCAGIYFGIEEIEGVPYLRLNVKGNVDGSVGIPHIYKVAMANRDITVIDDNDKITFYNGETLLATVDLNGMDKGYATEAIVTLADGTTETLTDVCAAATAASDIGFIARSVDMTFDGVILKNLGVEPEQPAGVPTIDGEPANPVKVVGADDLAAATGLNNVVITAGNGYTTFTFDGTVGTPGNDPYCSLVGGFDGARYVAVKYRAPEISANMNMQIYVGSGALANDDQSLQQVITADGEWHLLIFDLDELVTKMDANYHVNFLRLDALQAGIKYNEDGTPVVPNPDQPTTYEKLPIPEGASVDVAYIAFFNKEAEPEEPTILTPEEAGLKGKAHDSVTADNYNASVVGWMGFVDAEGNGIEMVNFGYSIDDGAIIWEGGKFNNFNTPEEGDIIRNLAGPAGRRFQIVAPVDSIAFGEHTVYFYVELANGTICNILTQNIVTKDPSAVSAATVNFNSAENADMKTLFKGFDGAPGSDCNWSSSAYHMSGITHAYVTMDGTYEWTVSNIQASAIVSTLFVRGSQTPNFGDACYFGHDGGVLGVGCAGIYFTVLNNALQINVRGINEAGGAVSHPYSVAMTGNSLKIVDDNKTIKFYEGDTLLATIEVSGNEGGYATQAVVTLADGTTETLTDVCLASSVVSDIGFAVRGSTLDFDAVTIKGA